VPAYFPCILHLLKLALLVLPTATAMTLACTNLGKEHSGKKAAAFLNRSSHELEITVSPEELGLSGRVIA
jgi:hypothetical protein